MTYHALTWNEDCSEGIWKDYATECDAQGFYSVTGPEQGKILVAHPDRQGYPAEIALPEDIRVGDVRGDYQLHVFWVRGVVLGPGGTPLKDGVVNYDPHPSRPGHTYMDNAGWRQAPIRAGRFEARVDRHGEYWFWVNLFRSESGIPSRKVRATVHSDTTLNIALDGHVVKGRVRSREEPVANAAVKASGSGVWAQCATDTQGHYQLYLPTGSYRFSVSPAERWIVPVDFPPDSVWEPRSIDFDVVGVLWSGIVKDATSGVPVDSVEIIAYDVPEQPGSMNALCLTGPGGRYQLLLRPNHFYELHLRDYRVGPVTRLASRSRIRDEDQVDVEYARVRRRRIPATAAHRDSTFDIRMEPVPR